MASRSLGSAMLRFGFIFINIFKLNEFVRYFSIYLIVFISMLLIVQYEKRKLWFHPYNNVLNFLYTVWTER